MRTNFLTWKAAARHGAGVILDFGGSGDPLRGYSLGGLQTALEALESMRRQFSSENGDGIRVVTLRTGGVPESIPARFAGRDALAKSLEDLTLLGRAARRSRTSATSPPSWPPTRPHDDRGDGERQRGRADRLGRSPSSTSRRGGRACAGLSIE